MDWVEVRLVFEWVDVACCWYMSHCAFGYGTGLGEGDCREGDWVV